MLEAKVKELMGKWKPKRCNKNFMSTAKKIIHRNCHEMHAAYAYRSNFMVIAVGTLVSHGGGGGAHT